MKNLIKSILQTVLGYQRYLYVFAKYKIRNLKTDRKEGDFFAFMDAIKKEGHILDVGANIGIMTYHLATRFKARTVHAVEPVPSNLTILHRIVRKYDLTNVIIHNTAVGSKDDQQVSMVLPQQGRVKMQGLAHVKHDSISEWNEGIEFTVQSQTLDRLFALERIAGIKMDIENFEAFALEGASKILSEQKPVLYLELWENENRYQCFDILEKHGYKAFVNSSKGLKPYDAQSDKKQNFVFIAD